MDVMPLKFIILASGSKGNATYLEIGTKKILIDSGISLRQIQSRLNARNIALDRVDAIFITHEHIDHVSGLIAVVRKYKSTIYMTEGTYHNLARIIKENLEQANIQLLKYDSPVTFSDFSVEPLVTYHDALEPCGYKFLENEKALVYITDTGYYPQVAFNAIRNAQSYIIEANHDPEMLLDSNRPWQLKRRILDDEGHLSNEDSAFLMANIIGDKTHKIVLAHLSQECNTKAKALEIYQEVFQKQGLIFADYHIECADQDQPLKEIEI
ncbi:MAG: MBL fold metallo-hydrolase [Candidatus Izemoplasmatales bacterium]|jgi:phosphoribosyl 1,2-cyclic phosphodiesterase